MRKGSMATLMALLVLLAACARPVGVGGEKGDRAAPGSTPPASGGGTASAEPTGSRSPEGVGTPAEETVCATARGGGDHVAQLVDVRVGSHAGYDRIVFEFGASRDGGSFGVPRFEVRPLEAPILDDPRGAVVPMRGSSFAGVVFHGATGVAFTTSVPQGYELTYDGPRELRPDFPVLVEAEQTGDFEATLSWAFGLSRPSCWEVSVLHDPLRVVIDFPSS